MSSTDSSATHRSPRAVVAFMMAWTGAMFFFVVLAGDLNTMTEAEWDDLPIGLILRYVLAMGLGGAFAGALLAGMFGRRSVLGWALAAIGGVLATLIAGMLGSAAARVPDLLADGWQMADLFSIGSGLLVVPFALAGKPLVAVPWVVLIAAAHILAKRARG